MLAMCKAGDKMASPSQEVSGLSHPCPSLDGENRSLELALEMSSTWMLWAHFQVQ